VLHPGIPGKSLNAETFQSSVVGSNDEDSLANLRSEVLIHLITWYNFFSKSKKGSPKTIEPSAEGNGVGSHQKPKTVSFGEVRLQFDGSKSVQNKVLRPKADTQTSNQPEWIKKVQEMQQKRYY
jgi:hypothetical protein